MKFFTAEKYPVYSIPLAGCIVDILLSLFHQSCGYNGGFEVQGVLSVEHTGKPHGTHDGVCLSLLVLASSDSELQPGGLSKWVMLEEEECVKRVRSALERDLGCTALLDLGYY